MNVRHETRALFLQKERQGGSALRALDVCPNRPFQPFALLLWGAMSETFVRQITIGRELQLTGPLPGYEFEADIAFEEFEALLSDRADRFMPAIDRPSNIGMFQRWDFPAVAVGSRIELTVEGPFDRAVLLGLVPRVEKEAA